MLDPLELACVFCLVHHHLDIDADHITREGGPLEQSRVRVSAEAAATLLAVSHGDPLESLNPHGWQMLVMAILDVELPEMVDPVWHAELPWVSEHAVARVIDRLPCLAAAAQSGMLVADCSVGPARHVATTFADHLMAALPTMD